MKRFLLLIVLILAGLGAACGSAPGDDPGAAATIAAAEATKAAARATEAAAVGAIAEASKAAESGGHPDTPAPGDDTDAAATIAAAEATKAAARATEAAAFVAKAAARATEAAAVGATVETTKSVEAGEQNDAPVPATPPHQCRVNTSKLNLREGPDTGFRVVSQMPNGTLFEGLERTVDGAWVFGISPEARGWASATYITCTYDLLQLPVGSLPPTYTPAPIDVVTPTPTTEDTPSPTPTVGVSLPDGSTSPPSGVAAQLGFFTPAGPGPWETLSSGETTDLGSVEIAERLLSDISGFTPDEDVFLQVVRPDGTILQLDTMRITAGVPNFWPLTVPPGEPLGVYTVTATQGQFQGKGTVTVTQAAAPRIMVRPKSGPPGTAFRIVLAGFQPNQRLYLYRLNGCPFGCWEYVIELPPAQVDSRGEAIYVLSTQPDDPDGVYLVVTQPSGAYSMISPGVFTLDKDLPAQPTPALTSNRSFAIDYGGCIGGTSESIGVVKGQVLDRGGRPVVSALVGINIDGRWWNSDANPARVNEDGWYEWFLGPGQRVNFVLLRMPDGVDADFSPRGFEVNATGGCFQKVSFREQ